MKKIILSAFMLAMTFSLFAQEGERQREAGIQFNDLNSFGLTYRTGTSKSLWRFNVFSTGIGSGSQTDVVNDIEIIDSSRFNLNFSVGKEYRTIIDANFEFRYGFDLGLGYAYNKTELSNDREGKSSAFSTNINAVIGFNYVINKKIVLGAEILPGFNYSFQNNETTDPQVTTETDSNQFNFNLNSNAARLSLVYRF